MNNDTDCFWYSPEGWRYSRGGVKVGPFDRFADAVEDYFEPGPLIVVTNAASVTEVSLVAD